MKITEQITEIQRDWAGIGMAHYYRAGDREEPHIDPYSSFHYDESDSDEGPGNELVEAGGTDPEDYEPPGNELVDTDELVDRMKGVIYGSCAGNTIGLLTDKMSKREASKTYGRHASLEYDHRLKDSYRNNWKLGDWTGDSDQMILIMDMIVENEGQVDRKIYAQLLRQWWKNGFHELGDSGTMIAGATTRDVIDNTAFLTDPYKVARELWERKKKEVAPNGAIMRTSVLGIHCHNDLQQVIVNTLEICKVTHADPRCQASCVAVTTAITLMLQQQMPYYNGRDYNIEQITSRCLEEAKKYLPRAKDHSELEQFIGTTRLSDLKLDEPSSQGYTYKTMGAGFWALRQDNFRTALQAVTMEGGDADTNGTVAGAMLGCKLGYNKIPDSWITDLRHKEWLDQRVQRFIELVTDF